MLFIKSLGRLALTRLTASAAAARQNVFIGKHLLSSSSLGPTAPSSSSSSSSPPPAGAATTKTVAESGAEAALRSSPPANSSSQGQQLIDIKDSCLNRLKQILDRPEEEYLRIQVETGGCSGFSYLFDIETNAKLDLEEDLIFERDNHRIVVNRDILPYMKGASIEYTDSLIKSSFQITNPVAETKCSCGSSFSIDLAKLSNSSQQADSNNK